MKRWLEFLVVWWMLVIQVVCCLFHSIANHIIGLYAELMLFQNWDTHKCFIFPFQVGILLHLASARAHQSLSIETALIIGGRWRYVFSFWICITWAVLTLLLSKLHCCFCFGNALHRVLPDLELICTCIDALKRMIRFWASCVHISWWYSFWTSHFTYKIQFIVCAFHFNMHRLAGVIPWWVKVLKRGWGTPKII